MKNFFIENKVTVYSMLAIWLLADIVCIYKTAKADKETYGGRWGAQIAKEFKNNPILAFCRYFFAPFVM